MAYDAESVNAQSLQVFDLRKTTQEQICTLKACPYVYDGQPLQGWMIVTTPCP